MKRSGGINLKKTVALLVIAVIAAFLVFSGCETGTTEDQSDGGSTAALVVTNPLPGVYKIDGTATSLNASNDVSWQTANWQKIDLPTVTIDTPHDVKFLIQIDVDTCPTSGTNPYFRLDDAVFKTTSGSNLLSNGEFVTNAYSSPLPISGVNQYNSWLPWQVNFTQRGISDGSVFPNNEAGYGAGDTGKVVAWNQGGNYTVLIQQTLSGVPAGDYTGSMYLLVGNVKATITLKAIPQ